MEELLTSKEYGHYLYEILDNYSSDRLDELKSLLNRDICKREVIHDLDSGIEIRSITKEYIRVTHNNENKIIKHNDSRDNRDLVVSDNKMILISNIGKILRLPCCCVLDKAILTNDIEVIRLIAEMTYIDDNYVFCFLEENYSKVDILEVLLVNLSPKNPDLMVHKYLNEYDVGGYVIEELELFIKYYGGLDITDSDGNRPIDIYVKKIIKDDNYNKSSLKMQEIIQILDPR